MSPRHGLVAGAVMAAGVAVVLATAPVTWFEDMLDVTGRDATLFLVRRYAASATAAIAVVAAGLLWGVEPRRAVLLGLGTWFALQAVTAWWGVTTDTVGGFAWAAAVADPLLATWFFLLSRRSGGDADGERISRRGEVR